MHSCVVEIQKVFIILSRKVSQCMLKMGLLLVKNARGDNSCLTLSTAHIRIYKVETEVYFCANFLIKSTLPLKPRCCCLKAIQKLFRPIFFWANKISLKSIRKHFHSFIWKKCCCHKQVFEAIVDNCWHVLGQTIFSYICWHTSNPVSNRQRKQGFNEKIKKNFPSEVFL